MKAFKKILAVISALVILTGTVPAFTAGAADVQDGIAAEAESVVPSPDNAAPAASDTEIPDSDSPEKSGQTAVGTGSPVIHVSGVNLSVAEKTIGIGESFDLTATIAPSDAADQTVTWSAKDTSVVSLTPSGKTCTVKGLSAGAVEVRAVSADGGFAAVCNVTVNDDKRITLNKSSVYMQKNDTYTLTATVSGYDDKTVAWSSSDSSVAAVSSTGVVTSSGKAGSAVVTAKAADGKTASCTVTVYLATPVITKATATTSGVKLEWNKVPDAAGYRVFRSQGTDGWSRVGDTTSLSLVDEKAVSGTDYTYTVRCMSADSRSYTSDYDKAGKAIFYVAAPSFSLSNVADGVKISWNKPAGAEKFRLFYKGKNGWTKLADTTDTSFIDKIVSSNRSYIYTVRCINSSATEFTSDYYAGKSILYVEAPKLTLSNATDGVSIKWNAVSGVSKYRVYYKGRNGWTRLTDTSSTSCVDNDVNSGKTYIYTIRAMNSSGQLVSSYYTDGFRITFIKAPVFSLTAVEDGIKISWDKPAGAENFRIFYRGSKGWNELADTTGTSFVDKIVSFDRIYTYTVRCINPSATKFTSDFRSGKSIHYVKAPKLYLSNATDGVNIKWNAVNGAYKYRVYYKSKNGWTKLTDTTSTSFVDTDVNSGKTYTYTIRVMDRNGQHISYYNTSGYKITFISAPVFSLSEVSNGIKISWNKPAGAEKFRVFYRDGDEWVKLTDTTDTSYVDKNVSSNSSYTYTVRCINSSGTEYTSGFRPGYSAGGTYIEISIDDQHMWVYKNGILIASTDVVTGNKGVSDTPTGKYSINNKARSTYLSGSGYSAYVEYWMAFIGSSYGIHDASWRSSFGGSIYNGDGSHGCVNTPKSSMSVIYENIPVGTPVIIY